MAEAETPEGKPPETRAERVEKLREEMVAVQAFFNTDEFRAGLNARANQILDIYDIVKKRRPNTTLDDIQKAIAVAEATGQSPMEVVVSGWELSQTLKDRRRDNNASLGASSFIRVNPVSSEGK